MATIRLDFANSQLATLQRARLPQGGLQLQNIPMSIGTAPGERMMQAGEALAGWAEVQRRTRAETEQNAARAAALRAMAEAESAAGGNIEEYRRRTGEALDRISEGIQDPEQRLRFREGIEPQAAGVEFRVRRAERARIGADGAASLEDVLRETGTRAAAAANPVERDALRTAGRERIAAAIEAGFLSPQVARERVLRWDAEISEATARRTMLEAPAEAARMLRDPAQLPGLTPVQRYALLDRALREESRAAGGRRSGRGARRVSSRGLPLPPGQPDGPPDAVDGETLPEPPPPRPRAPRAAIETGEDVAAEFGLSLSVQAMLDADGERAAEIADDAELREMTEAERSAFARADAMRTDAVVSWFRQAAGDTGADGSALSGMDDLLPAPVAEATRVVAMTGGAREDDPGTVAALDEVVTRLDPAEFQAEAARAVAGGTLSPAGWVRLVSANRETRQDREWRVIRERAVQDLAMPDLDAVAPGLGRELEAARALALGRMDHWRDENRRAGAGPARVQAQEFAQMARQDMADAAMRALPPPPGRRAGAGPWAPSVLDEAEERVMADLAEGVIEDREAARQLRVIEGWRWVGQQLDLGDEEPDPDAPGNARRRGGRMRVR